MLHSCSFTKLNKALLGAQFSPLKISVTKYDMGIEGFRVGSWIIIHFLRTAWLKCNESDEVSRGNSYRSPPGFRENYRFSYFFFYFQANDRTLTQIRQNNFLHRPVTTAFATCHRLFPLPSLWIILKTET